MQQVHSSATFQGQIRLLHFTAVHFTYIYMLLTIILCLQQPENRDMWKLVKNWQLTNMGERCHFRFLHVTITVAVFDQSGSFPQFFSALITTLQTPPFFLFSVV